VPKEEKPRGAEEGGQERLWPSPKSNRQTQVKAVMLRDSLPFGKLFAVASSALHRWRTPNPIDVLARRLRALFPEIAAAKPVLKHISELTPLRSGRTALAKSIFSLELDGYGSKTDAEILDFIRGSVDRDFNENKLVVLKGWTLSQTEILLIAFIGAGRA
jgi:hypothetical protein